MFVCFVTFRDVIQCLDRGHTVYKTTIVSVALLYLVCYFNFWFLELYGKLLLIYHINLFMIVLT